MPKLVFQNQDYTFSHYATIGRSSKCTVKIKDIKMSRIHCEIVQYNEEYILVDLHSQNGTQLNGSPITESFLKAGDKITVGRDELVFLQE